MRHLITFIYWMAAILLLGLLLVSFKYSFGRALFLATSLMPGMLCAKFCLPRVMQMSQRRIVAVGCVVCGVLIVEWAVLLLANFYADQDLYPLKEYPALLSNPVFIFILLAAFVIPEQLLSRWLKMRMPRDKQLSFISERHKVVVQSADVLFVESNNKEVLLHTESGACYRTKTRISQWERMLDERFMRIHRAYIINTDHVSGFTQLQVQLGGHQLDISRKYRESVTTHLRNIRSDIKATATT